MNATVRNQEIPEELGRISYIFSDKTGTLTQNVMDFQQLWAGGYTILILNIIIKHNN